MNIDLNVEAMSREVLEAKYFDLVSRYEAVTEYKYLSDDYIVLSRLARTVHGIGPQAIKLILFLMAGRLRTYDAINAHISLKPTEELSMDAYGKINLSKVIATHARKLLKPHNIEIENVWGQGYIMRPDHIKKLKQLIGEK